MMLNRFGPGELPSPAGPHPVTNTDVSTYQKIWAAARRLEYACPDTGTPGWCVVGTYLSLFYPVYSSVSFESDGR